MDEQPLAAATGLLGRPIEVYEVRSSSLWYPSGSLWEKLEVSGFPLSGGGFLGVFAFFPRVI